MATVDHVFAPLVRGEDVIVASSAIGCVGVRVEDGSVRWTEPLRVAGPFEHGHGAIAGPRCPAQVRCVSPHPGEPERSDDIDPLVRRARGAGIDAIAVLDRAGDAAALRGDTSMRRDRVVIFSDPPRVWDIPPPDDQEPRAEPIALATAGRDRVIVFWDGLHAAALEVP